MRCKQFRLVLWGELLPTFAPGLQALQRQAAAVRPSDASQRCVTNEAHWQWMQGQQPKQQLAKRNDQGWLEPMIFEPGKAAVLNIGGPYVLYRDGLAVTSVKQIQPLIKVLPSPVVDQCFTATWLPHWHAAAEVSRWHLLGSLLGEMSNASWTYAEGPSKSQPRTAAVEHLWVVSTSCTARIQACLLLLLLLLLLLAAAALSAAAAALSAGAQEGESNGHMAILKSRLARVILWS